MHHIQDYQELVAANFEHSIIAFKLLAIENSLKLRTDVVHQAPPDKRQAKLLLCTVLFCKPTTYNSLLWYLSIFLMHIFSEIKWII